MKTFARSLALTSLLLPSFLAYAYPPPCQRGDLYVGGTSYREANCIERRLIKPQKASRLQKTANPQVAPATTRRTYSEEIRKVYLHPVTSRPGRATLVKERNVKVRAHPIRFRTIDPVLRPPSSERGKSFGETRQDRRPAAKLSPRSKHARKKQGFLEQKALRHKMQDAIEWRARWQ